MILIFHLDQLANFRRARRFYSRHNVAGNYDCYEIGATADCDRGIRAGIPTPDQV